jgi:hypothetical protein
MPILVKRSIFVIPIDCLAAADSIKPEVTLSMPMVNKVIETKMFIIFRGRVRYPRTITNNDNANAIIPIPICKDRNQLGGFLLIKGHTTELYPINRAFSEMNKLFVCCDPNEEIITAIYNLKPVPITSYNTRTRDY